MRAHATVACRCAPGAPRAARAHMPLPPPPPPPRLPQGGEKQGKVAKLARNEVLMLNIGSMCTGARVLAVKHDLAKLQLTSPVCTKEGEKIALSRRVEKHWRLIGWGQIQKGAKIELPAAPARG